MELEKLETVTIKLAFKDFTTDRKEIGLLGGSGTNRSFVLLQKNFKYIKVERIV